MGGNNSDTKLLYSFLLPTKLQEGNVFRGVCLSMGECHEGFAMKGVCHEGGSVKGSVVLVEYWKVLHETNRCMHVNLKDLF